MTINNAVSRGLAALSGEVTSESLYRWLAEIEATVASELFETHTDVSFDPSPITPDDDGNRELLVPDPFSELYIMYFIMKNDIRLNDTAAYINSASVFASFYSAFADSFNRAHMPKGEKVKV